MESVGTVEQMGEDVELLRDWLALVVTDEVDRALTYVQTKMVERGPKLTGLFRGSIVPYLGEPSTFKPEKNLPSYQDHGEEAVAAAMSGFSVGDEVGVVSNVDHATRLARGWSKQAADGWVDLIAEEATRV